MTNQPILPIIFNNFLSFDNVFFRRLLIPDWVIFAIDAYHGRVEKYSVAQSQDVLRQALIEKNNGKTYLDYKDIRDGKCQGLFRDLKLFNALFTLLLMPFPDFSISADIVSSNNDLAS